MANLLWLSFSVNRAHPVSGFYQFSPVSWALDFIYRVRNTRFIEASQRHEGEDGAASREAYLYLLDLKEIIEKQWPLFATLFEAPCKGKSSSLEWFIRTRLEIEPHIRSSFVIALLIRKRSNFWKIDSVSFKIVLQKCGIGVSVPE